MVMNKKSMLHDCINNKSVLRCEWTLLRVGGQARVRLPPSSSNSLPLKWPLRGNFDRTRLSRKHNPNSTFSSSFGLPSRCHDRNNNNEPDLLCMIRVQLGSAT